MISGDLMSTATAEPVTAETTEPKARKPVRRQPGIVVPILAVEYEVLADSYTESTRIAKEQTAIRDEAKRRLLAALGDHNVAFLPDGRTVRKSVTECKELTTADYPDGIVRKAYSATSLTIG